MCRLGGLTGEQGVLIPRSTIRQLMLREDRVEALAEGRFHIWAISTVDEGLALLTGLPASDRDQSGAFAPESVNGRVASRLRAFAASLRAETALM